MKKILNQVKVVEERHTYLDINCFEKPICILLDNIGTGYSDVFFLYLKIIECYDIKSFQEEVLSNFFITMKYILSDKLHLTISVFEQPDNLHKTIMEQIDEGKPVMLGGNLKYLFYSKYYMEQDYAHLFLIKGYDAEKQIYYILDDKQRTDEKYDEFILPFQEIEKLYNGFLGKENGAVLWAMDMNPKVKNLDTGASLKECLKILLDNAGEEAIKEVMLCREIEKAVNDNDMEEGLELCSIFGNCTNYKQLLYQEVTKLYQENVESGKYGTELARTADMVLNEWRAVFKLCTVGVYRCKQMDLEERIQTALQSEEQIRNVFQKIIQE